jgi:pilus assembly protein Flp/PilA
MTFSRFAARLCRPRASAHSDDRGQGLAEYGLILSLIAVVCLAALTALGGSISGLLNGLAGNL